MGSSHLLTVRKVVPHNFLLEPSRRHVPTHVEPHAHQIELNTPLPLHHDPESHGTCAAHRHPHLEPPVPISDASGGVQLKLHQTLTVFLGLRRNLRRRLRRELLMFNGSQVVVRC